MVTIHTYSLFASTPFRQACVASLLATILIPLTLLGCSSEPPDDSDTRIVVQMFEGPEYDAMLPTAAYWNEHYAKSTGIAVEVVMLERVGYFGKLLTQLVAGLSTPDIVHPYSLHLGEIAPYLEPLDDYLADDELTIAPSGERLSLSMLFEPALETVRGTGDDLLMLPKDMSEVVLYYRKDLIESPPETWDDFIRIAKRFTRSINSDSPTEYGAVMQGKYEVWTFCAALENIWSHGASIFNESKTDTGFSLDATANGLRVFEDLARTGVLPPGSANAEYPEVAAIISQGNVALAMQWNAMYGSLTDPALSPVLHDKFGIAPPPGVRQEDGSLERWMFIQTIGLAINRRSEHKREAFRFLAWACLGEGSTIYTDAGGSSPTNRVWNDGDVGMPYEVLAPWAREFGRSVPHHPDLAQMMMIGASWVQRTMVGDVNSTEAARGMRDEIFDVISGEVEQRDAVGSEH